MTSKTRYVVIASLLVLAVGLGSGLLAYYVGSPAGAVSPQDGPDELRFIPAAVSVLAFADVHAVMTSPLHEKLRMLVPARERGGKEFASRTGINVETDIDHIVAASATVAADREAPDGLVLARGRFDVVRIEALMRDHGGQVQEFQGRRLILGNSPDGRRAVSLAFMAPGLIAVGSSEMVRAAATLANGGVNVTTNTELMSLVHELAPSTAWAVGRLDSLQSSSGMPADLGRRFPDIQSFSAHAFIDAGLRGVIRAQTKDEASANNLRDMVRGVMALARLQASSHPEIDAALRAVDLGGAGNTVALSFDVSPELFDLLGPLAAAGAGGQK